MTARLPIAPTSFGFTLVLGLLAALPPLSIDISAPTLLLLPAALHTTLFAAGLTLSLFMVGFAVGQLGGGWLSDRVGRRPVLLGGLACFAMAGLACALAPSAPALITCRLIQGFGAGTCAVLSFAMVQDAFQGDAARSKRSYVTVIVGLAPLLAPALGSLLTAFAGWRSVHGVLALAGSLLLALCWVAVAETRPVAVAPLRPARSPGRRWLERRFAGIALANALSYGCVFAYIAGSPVVIMGQMGLPAFVFAAVFALTAAALSAGAWTSGWLVRRGFVADAMLWPSLIVSAVAALALVAAGWAEQRAPAISLPPLLAVLFARGVIAPNLQHLAIELWPDQAGTASAVIGILQLSAGAVASAVVAALLPVMGEAGTSLPMAVLATSAVAAWWWARGAPRPFAVGGRGGGPTRP